MTDLSRRALGAATLALLAPPRGAFALTGKGPQYFAASVDTELNLYRVGARGALAKTATFDCPSTVQYAWQHPTLDILYLSCADVVPPTPAPGLAAPKAAPGGAWVVALAFVRRTGALTAHGPPAALPLRANHLSVDLPGRHILCASPVPPTVHVLALDADGRIGARIPQAPDLDVGNYPHQIRAMPVAGRVTLCTRGYPAEGDKPSDPGAIKVYDFSDGRLTLRQSIAPNGGVDYEPRHLDFHPTRRWVFVSREAESRLDVYAYDAQGNFEALPRFSVGTLADPLHRVRGQMAGPIHVHPDGRHVYLGNRGDMADPKGGGESAIAVFALDRTTGRPDLIQNVDTRGFHPRTFSISADGRTLIAANFRAAHPQGPDGPELPETLSAFTIGADGRLAFERSYPVVTAPDTRQEWWGGMVGPRA